MFRLNGPMRLRTGARLAIAPPLIVPLLIVAVGSLAGPALLVRKAPAVEPAPAAPATESVWETRTHAALRRESSAQGADQQQAVRDLAALYTALEKARPIDHDERAALRGLIARRLERVSLRISKRLAKEAKPAKSRPGIASRANSDNTTTANPTAANPTTGSVGSRAGSASASYAGAAGGQQVIDHGPELVELIQHTIAPQTWDVNGGNGSIVYFAPLRAIVVRQTADVHGEISAVLGNLRD